MARSGWCVVLVLAVAVVSITAREVPSDKGLKDEKNFLSFGGVGGYSGIGNGGIPFAGVGSGIGGAGSLFPGGGGSIGTGTSFPIGGGTGSTFPIGGFSGTGGGAGLGGGAGGGAGSGTLPLP